VALDIDLFLAGYSIFSMHRLFISAIAIICYYSTGAQVSLYKGKIGSYPVVMQLEISDTSVTGNYFYQSYKMTIPLEGSISNTGLITLSNNERTEFFQMKKKNDGFTGSWTNKEKSLRVEFQPISLSGFRNPYIQPGEVTKWKKERPFDFILSAGFRFEKLKTIIVNGIIINVLKEKYTKIESAEIIHPYNPAIKRINNRLKEKALSDAIAGSGCIGYQTNDNFETTLGEVYGNRSVFSISFFTSYYCGGAHPDEGSGCYNFDMKTGSMLALEDVLWLGKGKPPAESSDGWYRYRDSVLAPWLVKTFTQLFPDKINGTNDSECNYSDPQSWQWINWNFTNSGLHIAPQFAHYNAPCENPAWTIIPYSFLRKIKAYRVTFH
jgi:hypothetical protein